MEKDIEREYNATEPYSESSDENIDRDLARRELGNLPSNVTPESYFEYKRFINLPESQAEFEHKIDKDVVLGNFGGALPSFEELCFDLGTIELFEGMFVIPHRINIVDENGKQVVDANGHPVVRIMNIFDEEFRDSLNFLKGRYKFRIVGSRGLGGNSRAAILDISNRQNIEKNFSKGKENRAKLMGLGGN